MQVINYEPLGKMLDNDEEKRFLYS